MVPEGGDCRNHVPTRERNMSYSRHFSQTIGTHAHHFMQVVCMYIHTYSTCMYVRMYCMYITYCSVYKFWGKVEAREFHCNVHVLVLLYVHKTLTTCYHFVFHLTPFFFFFKHTGMKCLLSLIFYFKKCEYLTLVVEFIFCCSSLILFYICTPIGYDAN